MLAGLLLLVCLLAVVYVASRPDSGSASMVPLKDLAAKKGLSLGVYAALKRIDEPQYDQILNRDFDFVVVDGEPNWQFNDGALRPSETEFDYTNMDTVIRYADAHHKPFRIHHLVWGEEKWLPTWLKNSKYSKAELLELIHAHIREVAGHYRGRVREWTVVNEAFTRGQHQRGLRDWWGDHIGQEYIEKAFTWARQADPNAKLILNDFNSESKNSVSDAMYKAIQHMKQTGVPIDGVGLQMHIDGSHPPDKDDVIINMKRFGALGVDVYVTEFDVNMNDAPGSDEDKANKQAQVYYDMMRACIESNVCHSFALLGITDKESWYNELGVPNAMPLPFDKTYQTKPAYFALERALSE